MEISTKTERMNITISPFLKNEINNISKELGKSKSGLISEALEYYFDILDLSIAEKRKNDKNIPSDDMRNFINGL